MRKSSLSWICFQIGAREHYAIPRALQQQQQLTHLVTDAWVKPNSLFNLLPQSILSNLRERFHPQLAFSSVSSFNFSLIQFEISHKFKQQSSWQTIIERNHWFQQQSLEFFKKIAPQITSPVTIFSYSYAALEIFKFAKEQGWETILGQIDPGICEEQIVKKEGILHPQYISTCQQAPHEYWQDWQQECELANQIIVNSRWSKKALQKVGISSKKIEIIPLAYTPPTITNKFTRVYPKKFSSQRPLKVLFLGQIILRKGIAKIFEAIELLADKPIEFWFVGSLGINLPQTLKNNSKVKWFGSVCRSKTSHFYQKADVFLFPTLSDGFGLTQLEAQAWQLPIIASQYCGEVVKDNINGFILPEVTTKNIVTSLLFCLKNPDLLHIFSQKANENLSEFSLANLEKNLEILNRNQIIISR